MLLIVAVTLRGCLQDSEACVFPDTKPVMFDFKHMGAPNHVGQFGSLAIIRHGAWRMKV